MKKYEGYTGIVEKFGKLWRWIRQFRHDLETNRSIEIFKVEPHYEIDLSQPRWRPGEEDTLTMTITVRGTPYTFPAVRLPCRSCDGGIRRKLGLRPHGGVCYCDSTDFTIIDFYHDKMTNEQKITVATYHLDLQMSSFW
jgi:hypothetical protein